VADADVLILGASMAGVELWHRLRNDARGRELSIAVVDRQERHGYIPLVQERICRRLPEPSTVQTRRWMQADPRVQWETAEVLGFDPDRCEAVLGDGRRIRGRYVVVALGSTVAAPPRLPGAQYLHGHKLEDETEQAARALDAILSTRASPRIVVIGGGISGVEMAGEIADLRRNRSPKWAIPKVTLVHGADRLLPHLGARASRIADRSLRKQGIEILAETRVLGATENTVQVRDESGLRSIPFDLAFWAGGVRAPSILCRLGLPTTRSGWLQVSPTLQCMPATQPTIFACGDDCRVVDRSREWPTMQRAIECIWQAGAVSRSILAMEAGGSPVRHSLHTDFFHGVSMGRYSMITYGPFALEMGAFAIWFRRFLMRQYLARYRAA
jgi:NADH:ubiquinone reductase (H+-translocating)